MWNSRYVSEVDNTLGRFLPPNSLKLAALMTGSKHSVPANPTHLELDACKILGSN